MLCDIAVSPLAKVNVRDWEETSCSGMVSPQAVCVHAESRVKSIVVRSYLFISSLHSSLLTNMTLCRRPLACEIHEVSVNVCVGELIVMDAPSCAPLSFTPCLASRRALFARRRRRRVSQNVSR